MSAPDIFFHPPKKARWSDPCFISLGRLLALSQRVESLCRSLAILIQIRSDPLPLDSDEAIQALCKGIEKQKLHEHVTLLADMCGNDALLFNTLKDAKDARNEVAHEVALGFEHWAYNENLSKDASAHVQELARKLARADQVLCAIASWLTHEPMPSSLGTYPEDLVAWVCNSDNGEPW